MKGDIFILHMHRQCTLPAEQRSTTVFGSETKQVGHSSTRDVACFRLAFAGRDVCELGIHDEVPLFGMIQGFM